MAFMFVISTRMHLHENGCLSGALLDFYFHAKMLHEFVDNENECIFAVMKLIFEFLIAVACSRLRDSGERN